MKILNLYSGLGGNRKLWPDEHKITSVELDESIGAFYRKEYPQDELIITDAHDFLLNNYFKYDFIWTSPPCPSHSKARFGNKKLDKIYPDLKLYEEIIFLQTHFKGKFIVENVIPYYEPLIPARKFGRHLIWTNFVVPVKQFDEDENKIVSGKYADWEKKHGISLEGFKFNQRKDKILRNCVDAEIGEYILNVAQNIIIKEDVRQTELFL